MKVNIGKRKTKNKQTSEREYRKTKNKQTSESEYRKTKNEKQNNFSLLYLVLNFKSKLGTYGHNLLAYERGANASFAYEQG